jgi:hypothetical protein
MYFRHRRTSGHQVPERAVRDRCAGDIVSEPLARVAELADALASGASVRKDVGVQVPPRAREMWTEPLALQGVLSRLRRLDGRRSRSPSLGAVPSRHCPNRPSISVGSPRREGPRTGLRLHRRWQHARVRRTRARLRPLRRMARNRRCEGPEPRRRHRHRFDLSPTRPGSNSTLVAGHATRWTRPRTAPSRLRGRRVRLEVEVE